MTEGEEPAKPARKPRAKKAETAEGEEPAKKTTRKRATKRAAEAPAEE